MTDKQRQTSRKGVAQRISDDSCVVDSSGTAPNGAQIRAQIKRIAKKVRELYPVERTNE